MLRNIILWFETHMGTCSFKSQAGIECPGCGMQRSIIALLKGEILESILVFPALVPMIAMFGFLGIHLAFNLKHGALVLKIFFILNISLIFGSYIFKLIIH